MERFKEYLLWLLVWFIIPVVSTFLFTVYFVFFSDWKINEEVSVNIDISNLAVILVTLMVSVILVRRLGKKDEVSKIKYTNMCNLINNFEEDFKRKIKNIIETGTADIKKAGLLLQSHGIRINKLKQLAIQHHYLDKDSPEFLNIEKNFIELRKVIDEPVVAPGEIFYKYTEEQLRRADEIVDERQLLIFELTILLSSK